jgi:hypothetical protein
MELNLNYRSGWARDTGLEDALKATLGSRPAGRHDPGWPAARRASSRLNGAPIKDRISRGLQKLLAAAPLVPQLDLFLQGGSSDAADVVVGKARGPLAAGALVAAGSSRRLSPLLIRASSERSV